MSRWQFGSLSGWLSYKFDTIYKQLSSFSLFDPLFIPRVFLGALVVANLLIVLAFVFVAVEKTRLAFQDSSPIPSVVGRRTAIVGLAGVFFVAPKGFVGLVNPGERLVLPLIILALSLPYRPRLPSLLHRAMMPAVAGLLLFQLGFISVQGHRAATVMHSLITEVAGVQGELALIQESHFEDPSIPPRPAYLRSYAALPRHYPLVRAPLYIANEQQLTVPIFDTGLFKAVAHAETIRDIDSAGRNNSAIFVVGEQKRVAKIARRVSRHEVISLGTYHALLGSPGNTPRLPSQRLPSPLGSRIPDKSPE